MKKSEMFDIILDEVSEVCEVSKESIIKGVKIQAVVDARMLCVQYLKRIGLSSDDIALITLRRQGKDPTLEEIRSKAKSVDKQFDTYSQRCVESYSFCLMSRDISLFCREQYNILFVDGMKKLPK